MLICGVRLPSHETRNKCKWFPNVTRSLLAVEGVSVEFCPHHGAGKSWTDDPVESRYCRCWERPLCFDPLSIIHTSFDLFFPLLADLNFKNWPLILEDSSKIKGHHTEDWHGSRASFAISIDLFFPVFFYCFPLVLVNEGFWRKPPFRDLALGASPWVFCPPHTDWYIGSLKTSKAPNFS